MKKLKKLKDTVAYQNSASEKRRQELKSIRKKEEGEVFKQINKNNNPKMYKGRSSGIDSKSGSVNRGKDWYSK